MTPQQEACELRAAEGETCGGSNTAEYWKTRICDRWPARPDSTDPSISHCTWCGALKGTPAGEHCSIGLAPNERPFGTPIAVTVPAPALNDDHADDELEVVAA